MKPEATVLFVAGDPGGAAALLPVIKSWTGRKVVLAYRQAAKSYGDAAIETGELEDATAGTETAGTWIEKSQAALVVGATSVNGVDWERHFFIAARQRRVPSLSVLDYWSNYAPRFTLVQRLDALPDAIAIMDDRARDEMIAEGFPPDRLVITGQPVLDEARQWRAGITPAHRGQFRSQLGLSPHQTAFLFISQPLREMRQATGDTTTADDEFAGLSKLVETIAGAASPTEKVLLVKTHPREQTGKFDAILRHLPFPARVVNPQIHRWQVCLAVDHLFGASSMLLEEARALGCTVHCLTSDAAIELNASAFPEAKPAASALSLATMQITRLIAGRLSAAAAKA